MKADDHRKKARARVSYVRAGFKEVRHQLKQGNCPKAFKALTGLAFAASAYYSQARWTKAPAPAHMPTGGVVQAQVINVTQKFLDRCIR